MPPEIQSTGTPLAEAPPDLTVRTCARCGNHYVWPKNTRRASGECPRCEPPLPGLEPAVNRKDPAR